MQEQTFENVWDAIEDSPSEAANMTARSDLLIALQETVVGWRITQTEAAARLGVTQPRLNDMIKGKIGRFSLDALVNLAARAGLDVSIAVEPRAA
jgi:predicted XRE-type DNA-binding protein